jgi:23S rRNA pseudouridine1911/1915/1917 synthase
LTPDNLKEEDIIIVEPWAQGFRLDVFLSTKLSRASRSYFQQLIDDGLVVVNGSPKKKSYKVETRDEIEVHFAITEELEAEAEDIPLDVLYEDSSLICVNKPPSLVVHPAHGNMRGTFVNALLFHCKDLERTSEVRPGIVHRLDKDTSGVLLAAKTRYVQEKLSSQFQARRIKKRYLALVLGAPKDQTISAPIGRHPVFRKEMAVLASGGKEAITHLKVLRQNKELSLVELELETGRTHQIRVHLKHIGHPVLGDETYGKKSINEKFGACRQMLHAESLTFFHPILKKEMTIKAPLCQDFLSIEEKYL